MGCYDDREDGREDDRESDARYEARMDAKRDESAQPTYFYNCGGPRAYDGPCGTPDCGYCRNGEMPYDDEDEDEDEDEESTPLEAT